MSVDDTRRAILEAGGTTYLKSKKDMPDDVRQRVMGYMKAQLALLNGTELPELRMREAIAKKDETGATAQVHGRSKPDTNA